VERVCAPKDFGGPGEVDAETPWHHLLIITTVHAACDEVANAIRILVARYSWIEFAPLKILEVWEKLMRRRHGTICPLDEVPAQVSLHEQTPLPDLGIKEVMGNFIG
jgi:hypothetical protein